MIYELIYLFHIPILNLELLGLQLHTLQMDFLLVLHMDVFML